jgi:hypothetical protein
MKKIFSVLAICVFVLMMVISFAGYAEGARTDGRYITREEIEYGRTGMLERQEERNWQIRLQQYQQQQYLQQQQLLNQQNMYNQAHQSGLKSSIIEQEGQ